MKDCVQCNEIRVWCLQWETDLEALEHEVSTYPFELPGLPAVVEL